jgi:polyphosphate glucokinase
VRAAEVRVAGKKVATKIAKTTAKKTADKIAKAAVAKARGPFTLAIDIGGTGLKASVLDAAGKMMTERVRVETPHPCNPVLLVETLAKLVAPLPAFDRISVGFPGLIRHGVIHTAPNLGTEAFAGFNLAKALEKKLKKPVRAVNDADMQGLAAIQGTGVEMVCTLGTGFGTALFNDAKLQVHLEIAHHPFRKSTYDDTIGDRGRKKVGNKKWRKLVDETIVNMRTMVNFDRLYVGGGNAKRLKGKLPKDVSLVDNAAGILGGIKLWDDVHEDV